MDGSNLNQHLVIHDAAALALAAVLGLVAFIFSDSLMLGLATVVLLSGVGIGMMRVSFFRRLVNRMMPVARKGEVRMEFAEKLTHRQSPLGEELSRRAAERGSQ